MATPRRTAIVRRKNNVAFLRHQLVPEKIGTAPGVSNHLSVRPTIRVYQHGVFLLQIEVWRLDNAGVQLPAVAGFHANKFHGREMVVGKFGHFVFVDGSDARSVGAVKILTRRGSRTGKSINKSGSVWREDRGVRAFFLCEACKTRAIKSDPIELPLKGRFLRRGEVNETVYFVNAVEPGDFPIALGELRELPAANIVQI